jgi:Domain of unknown function (DUF4333)
MLFSIKNHLQLRNIRRVAPTLTLVVGSAFALTSCTVYLTQDSVEEAIANGYKAQTQIQLDSVTCPEEMEATVDNSYECSAIAQDVRLTFTVKPTGGTNIHWEVTQLAVAGTTVEKEVKAGLEQELAISLDSVTCPNEIIAEAGQLYQCTVTAGDESAIVEVTPTGESTNFNWELKQAG